MDREKAIDTVKLYWPIDEGRPVLREAIECLIPELKDSEDEKIRKNIITFLDELFSLGKNANFDKWSKSDCSEWIAWLEKQGEQKSAWSEEDERRFTQANVFIENTILKDVDDIKASLITWLKSFKDRCTLKVGGEQKSMEWSEEDENNRQETLYFIREFQKSNRCKDEGDMQNSVTCEKWLENLKPQNHWKPSGDLLDLVYHYSQQNNLDGSMFHSLYQELKKL